MDNERLLAWSLVAAGSLLDVAVAKGWKGWYQFTPPRGVDANLVIGTASIGVGAYLLSKPEQQHASSRSGVAQRSSRRRYRGR